LAARRETGRVTLPGVRPLQRGVRRPVTGVAPATLGSPGRGRQGTLGGRCHRRSQL